MLLVTTFVELRVVALRSRTRVGRPHVFSRRSMIIHSCHGAEESLSDRQVVAWQGRGMVCVNQTRPYCVNQMGKTQSKPFLARHGRGTAWYVQVSLKTALEWCRADGKSECAIPLRPQHPFMAWTGTDLQQWFTTR
jgi:hypothetical protein